MARGAFEGDAAFRLRPSMILSLHREALDGLSSYAGNYRPGSVEIGNSKHQPPGAHLVSELVEGLCDYVNSAWEEESAIHLAAYIMWRLNWIHPFTDGSGRTSRIVSYLVLTIKSGHLLPGAVTIPEQIVKNRRPYFEALEHSDACFAESGKIGVGQMEALIESLLAAQLIEFLRSVGGLAARE